MAKLSDARRVVVTGLGAASSVGIGWKLFWRNICDGVSGIGPIRSFPTSGYRTSIGGEIHKLEEHDYVRSIASKKYGRTSQLAIVAAKLALEDANIAIAKLDSENTEILLGTTNGESQILEGIDLAWVQGGESQVLKPDILKYPGNIIAVNLAKELGLSSYSMLIPTACAAGNYAIGYAYDLIVDEAITLAIVGGADGFSKVAFAGFNRMFAAAPDCCRPFDKNRAGMIVGEGAGIIILESLANAKARDASIYAEVLGYGLSCDASHMTIPDGKGIQRAMENAMVAAGIDRSEVNYISAHGTGTQMNDKTEAQAIRRVFGNHADKMPVSSIKSMLGHTMGAASALEAIGCVLAIFKSQIPPTINHQTWDEECPIDCVPNHGRSQNVDIALNNSLAFGGNNACIVFSKYEA